MLSSCPFHFHTQRFPPFFRGILKSNPSDGKIAVIAAQFQMTETGETTPLLTSVMENIGKISTPGTVTETGALDFAPLVDVLSKQSMHTYTGSLTTPPCAEGLTFFVTSQQLPLDVATFNKVKAVVGFNARFTQNTAGEENLLGLASKTVVAVGGGATGVAPPAAAPAESAKEAIASPAPVASAFPVAKIIPGGAATVVNGGSNSQVNEIIKGLTGIDLGSLLGQ
jgi:hypothetical protein